MAPEGHVAGTGLDFALYYAGCACALSTATVLGREALAIMIDSTVVGTIGGQAGNGGAVVSSIQARASVAPVTG